MGLGSRNQIMVGLALVMMLGIAVYLRLWTIDYTVSADDTELLRFASHKLCLCLLCSVLHFLFVLGLSEFVVHCSIVNTWNYVRMVMQLKFGFGQ